jgi:nucleotide-binding universal stress UspA family protein
MGPIVCATRGGEASRRTQEQAIALALEGGLPLIFLFVADTNFANPANEAIAQALADELEQLGKRLLCIAQSRAREQGLDADIEVRRGSVRQAIEGFLKEVNAQTLILGAPQSNSEPQTFAPDELPHFAQEIQASTGVEVVVVT